MQYVEKAGPGDVSQGFEKGRKGRFPFSQKFRNLRNGDKFQKIRKFLNFRKANHSMENSGNFGMKIKWNGNLQEKIFENSGIPWEVVLFF